MWVAQGWLVYDLTKEAVYLGYVGLASAAPAILLNLAGGVVADRFDQRRVIFVTQAVSAAVVGVIAALTALDAIEVWHIIVGAFVSGSMQAFNNPARQSIFPQLVDRKDLMNAVALNSMVWQGTRIVAPAIGGVVLAAFGAASAFALCCAGFFVLGLAVIGLQTEAPSRARASAFADLKEGLSFISANFVFAFSSS